VKPKLVQDKKKITRINIVFFFIVGKKILLLILEITYKFRYDL